MDTIIGIGMCILILCFFVFSYVYLSLEKKHIRLVSFWLQMEGLASEWLEQTAHIALKFEGSCASSEIMELRSQYQCAKHTETKIACIRCICEIYEQSDVMVGVGDRDPDRRNLCTRINYESFYLNEAVEQQNQYLQGVLAETIGRALNVGACCRFPDLV